jgi:hypothetical protein
VYDGELFIRFMKSLYIVDVRKLPDSKKGILRVSDRKDYFLHFDKRVSDRLVSFESDISNELLRGSDGKVFLGFLSCL